MAKTKLTRIGVASLAAFTGVITWVIALLFGWPLLFLETFLPGSGMASFGVFVVGGLAVGLVVGAVSALIYNIAARFMGGIALDFESA